jgi:hypothetical protein
MPDSLDLEGVLDLLGTFHVRATYGAVGAVVGRPATFLMNDLPRTPRYSWIVNARTLQPTGYADSEKHPELATNRMVLKTAAQLRNWLARKALNIRHP